jgi:hypothetical protein
MRIARKMGRLKAASYSPISGDLNFIESDSKVPTVWMKQYFKVHYRGYVFMSFDRKTKMKTSLRKSRHNIEISLRKNGSE